MFGGDGWRIGRLGGVETRPDLSGSVIVGPAAYTLRTPLPLVLDDTGPVRLSALAVAMFVVLRAGVLVHQVTFAWVAPSRGVRVRGITLVRLCGATQADIATQNPTDDFAVAGVGALTSFRPCHDIVMSPVRRADPATMAVF